MVSQWEMVLRLGLAAICGALLGFERELTRHPAGVRTLALVSMGAALILLTDLYLHTTLKTQDSFRLAAQVVTGVGFIGAGTILQIQASVKGLTTAAAIWIAAAIGLAIGAGFYLVGLGAALLTLIALMVEPYSSALARRLRTRREKRRRKGSLEEPPTDSP